jgi:hypothetical protein
MMAAPEKLTSSPVVILRSRRHRNQQPNSTRLPIIDFSRKLVALAPAAAIISPIVANRPSTGDMHHVDVHR